jgi:hypothetical protein
MTRVLSAHELALSHDCIIPQCPREASGDDGRCDHCRKAGRTGTAQTDVIEIHRGRVVKQFECQTDGCTNTVKTNKGTGGYCVELQPNGKTHRQEWIEERRKADPSFMKKTVSGRGLHVSEKLVVPPPPIIPPPEPQPDPDDDVIVGAEERSLLDQIADATNMVKRAQADLRAKERLLTRLMQQFLNQSEGGSQE